MKIVKVIAVLLSLCFLVGCVGAAKYKIKNVNRGIDTTYDETISLYRGPGMHLGFENTPGIKSNKFSVMTAVFPEKVLYDELCVRERFHWHGLTRLSTNELRPTQFIYYGTSFQKGHAKGEIMAYVLIDATEAELQQDYNVGMLTTDVSRLYGMHGNSWVNIDRDTFLKDGAYRRDMMRRVTRFRNFKQVPEYYWAFVNAKKESWLNRYIDGSEIYTPFSRNEFGDIAKENRAITPWQKFMKYGNPFYISTGDLASGGASTLITRPWKAVMSQRAPDHGCEKNSIKSLGHKELVDHIIRDNKSQN